MNGLVGASEISCKTMYAFAVCQGFRWIDLPVTYTLFIHFGNLICSSLSSATPIVR